MKAGVHLFRIMLGLAFIAVPFRQVCAGTSEPLVRVLIQNNISDCTISIPGRYELLDPKTGQVRESSRRLKPSVISVSEGKIMFGAKGPQGERLRISARDNLMIDVKGTTKRYRGTVDIILSKSKKLLIINSVELETYLKGVLYHEVTDRWPLEAMKAQAVAARTYAYFQLQKNKANEYDVTGDIYSQVYGGRSAERYRTNLAVRQTQGEILKYQGKVLPAYFHANCGGHTENVKALWPDQKDFRPLWGSLCPYCRDRPAYRWKKNFRLKDIQETLNKNGYAVGTIKEINIVKRDESGRIDQLEFLSRDGSRLKVDGRKFRELIGPNVIRSNNYDVVMKGYYCDLVGKGWGHGVGMCQWGAYGMSLQRFDYQQILSFYYPGADLSKINDR